MAVVPSEINPYCSEINPYRSATNADGSAKHSYRSEINPTTDEMAVCTQSINPLRSAVKMGF